MQAITKTRVKKLFSVLSVAVALRGMTPVPVYAEQQGSLNEENSYQQSSNLPSAVVETVNDDADIEERLRKIEKAKLNYSDELDSLSSIENSLKSCVTDVTVGNYTGNGVEILDFIKKNKNISYFFLYDIDNNIDMSVEDYMEAIKIVANRSLSFSLFDLSNSKTNESMLNTPYVFDDNWKGELYQTILNEKGMRDDPTLYEVLKMPSCLLDSNMVDNLNQDEIIEFIKYLIEETPIANVTLPESGLDIPIKDLPEGTVFPIKYGKLPGEEGLFLNRVSHMKLPEDIPDEDMKGKFVEIMICDHGEARYKISFDAYKGLLDSLDEQKRSKGCYDLNNDDLFDIKDIIADIRQQEMNDEEEKINIDEQLDDYFDGEDNKKIDIDRYESSESYADIVK